MMTMTHTEAALMTLAEPLVIQIHQIKVQEEAEKAVMKMIEIAGKNAETAESTEKEIETAEELKVVRANQRTDVSKEEKIESIAMIQSTQMRTPTTRQINPVSTLTKRMKRETGCGLESDQRSQVRMANLPRDSSLSTALMMRWTNLTRAKSLSRQMVLFGD